MTDSEQAKVETIQEKHKVKKVKKFKPKKLVMNVLQTKYHVVKYTVKKEFGFRLSTN